MSGTVSTASIICMAIQVLISVGLPVAMLIIFRKKTKAQLVWTLIGMCTFVLFALIIESIFHRVMIDIFGESLTGNVWVYGIYGGIAAGVFEETGRYLAMKFLDKGNLNKQNSIMYGIGHGGVESIIIVGLASISNIITSFLINSGAMEASLAALDETNKATTLATLNALIEAKPYMFLLGGIERISAIALHVCLSYMVYRAVKDKKISLFIIAIAIHALVDAGTVIISKYLGAIALECILFVVVAAFAVYTYKAYKSRNEEAVA
ncbi:MAG: YhfC family intramembrane metalloprotease [Lachnospiraceae bacterium]|nr:YhfC family intramembrane metalloprotease [Lachnospiraceae bacterium]